MHYRCNDDIEGGDDIWRARVDVEQVAQQAASQQLPETAVDAEQVAPEIAVRYVQEPAQEPAIQPARRFAIMGAQTNALDANGLAQMIARQDAKRIAFRHAQQIVRIPAQTAQVAAETVALRPVLMTAQVDAKAVAIRHAQRIA